MSELPYMIRTICVHGTEIECCEEHDCIKCEEEFYASLGCED